MTDSLVPAAEYTEVTDAALAAYRRDGFLVLRGVVHGAELEALRSASDRVMAEAVAYGRELDARAPARLQTDHGFYEWDEIDERQFLYARDAQGRRVWRRAQAMWPRDPAFRGVTANPRLVAAAERLAGVAVLPAHESMVVKMPGAGAAIPWHRDPPGRALIEQLGDASSDFICDVYVDASTRDNGCVWGLPGSHRTAEEADSLDFDRPDAVALEAEPGDVAFHSTGVVHGSPGNASGALRRTFYVHYSGAEALHTGFWKRDWDWIEAQREAFASMQAERAARGWD
jgi:hypothetical protein